MKSQILYGVEEKKPSILMVQRVAGTKLQTLLLLECESKSFILKPPKADIIYLLANPPLCLRLLPQCNLLHAEESKAVNEGVSAAVNTHHHYHKIPSQK